MDNVVIEFNNVNKSYEQTNILALKEVSFSVQSEAFLCIIGPSGCGKSTVLKIIAGLEQQTSGTVTKPDSIAMVFQSGALLPWLTTYENIAFSLRAKHHSEKYIHDEVDKFIELTGLNDFAQKFPRDLSGGQRQRVGLARALAINPKILLLDEPFSALDMVTTEELHKDLIRLWRHLHQTIILVSHSIEEAVSLADKVILMKQGEVSKTFEIPLQRPRREQGESFTRHVMEIRSEFFKL